MRFSEYREFFKLFIPLAGIVIATTIVMAVSQHKTFRERVGIRQKSLVLMEKQIFETSLAVHLSDAIILAEIAAIHLSENGQEQAVYGLLAKEFFEFARGRRIYDQVRYLDRNGMERVRVNLTPKGPQIVSEDELQEKSGRPYFLRGMRTAGDVFVSRFDLNVEKGQVERPIKPMVRLASPVTDEKGRKHGVVVLNYMGTSLLDRVRKAASNSPGRLFVLNAKGFWLIGPAPEQEWGFMFKEGKTRTIERLYPEEWARMADGDSGQFHSPNGLFTFDTVHPLISHLGVASRLEHGEAEESWKIMAVVPDSKLTPPWWPQVFWLCLGLFSLMGIVVWQWAKTRNRRREAVAKLTESEEKLRTISNSVQDAIVMIDGSGKTTFWSSSASKMFGYDHEEIIGRDLHTFVASDEDKQTAQAGLDSFGITGQGTVVGKLREVSAVRKGGVEFPAEISVAPILISDEWFAVASIRDVTDRKRVEEELAKHREHLEDLVQERTKALTLTNEELQREMAKREQAQHALRQAKEGLQVKVAERTKELSEANHELSLLSTMGGHLIACSTVEEACKMVISKYLRHLFPGSSGGVYVAGDHRNIMDLIAAWGEYPPLEKVFGADKCWALRHGRLHSVTHSSPEPLCLHLPEVTPRDYLCVPMISQSETLGMLHIRYDAPTTQVENRHTMGFTDAKQQLAVTVAEKIGMTLANLQLRETLRFQSVRDPVTGIFNRRHMEESLSREFFRAKRLDGSVGVMMLDIDHFKLFNDTFGHEAGDTLLKELGDFMVRNLRKEDIPCRFGGEEFIAILPGATLADTQDRAQELRKGVQDLNVFHNGRELGQISLSVGVAVFPDHGSSVPDVLRAVDAALYKAKTNGRNRVETAEPIG